MANERDTPESKPASKVADVKTLQYRFVGDHAEILANGRPVEPGGFIDLTEEEVRDPFYEGLIHDGVLIGTDEAAEHEVALATRRVERRINNEDGEES